MTLAAAYEAPTKFVPAKVMLEAFVFEPLTTLTLTCLRPCVALSPTGWGRLSPDKDRKAERAKCNGFAIISSFTVVPAVELRFYHRGPGGTTPPSLLDRRCNGRH